MVVALILAATAGEAFAEQQALIREATRVDVVRVSDDLNAGFPEQGKPIELKGALARRAIEVFGAKGVVELDRHSACMFSPGVKYRFTKGDKQVSVLVCFHCHELEATNDQPLSFEPAYTALLRLTKKAFPGDPDLKALEEEQLPHLESINLGDKAELLGAMIDGKPKLVPIPKELFRSLKELVTARESYVVADPEAACIGPEPDIAVRVSAVSDWFIIFNSKCGTVRIEEKGVYPMDGRLRTTPAFNKIAKALLALDK